MLPVERGAVAAALLWLLVGPRLDLPGAAPLRVEDLVLGLLAVLCVRHLRSFGAQRLVAAAVGVVVVTGLVAAAAAILRGTVPPVSSVLFAIRPAEYLVALPATLLLVRGVDARWRGVMDVLLGVTTVLQTAFAVLQYYFALPIGFSHAAYTRAAGLTVGPYELGAISAMLAVYWMSRGRWVLVSMSIVAVAASVSRISLLGAAVGLGVLSIVWIIRFAKRARTGTVRAELQPYLAAPVRLAVQAVSVAAAAAVLALTLGVVKLPAADEPQAAAPPAAASAAPTTAAPTAAPSTSPSTDDLPSQPSETVQTRLADTSILGSWNAAAGIAAAVPPVRAAWEYQDIAYARLNEHVNADNAAQLGAEPSNLVRFFRWHLILDSMREPVNVVLGLGPSWVGPSVDGSYLRMYADAGVIGVLAWLALIVVWLRRSPLWMVCVTMTMLVGGIFIDILYAERPMVLFWALLAVAAATPRQGNRREPAPAAAVPLSVAPRPTLRSTPPSGVQHPVGARS